MTLIVGILCSDGVVMASDSAATFGTGGLATIGQQPVQKVRKIGDNILYSATGAVGIAQLISARIGERWGNGGLKDIKTLEAMMQRLAGEIGGVVNPFLQSAQAQKNLTGDASTSLCKSLVAIPVDKKAHLFQFDFNGAPEGCTKELPFVALGSGQLIADPFLAFLKRLLWSDHEPTIAEGRLAAVWTIDHVSRTNAGGVGGAIQLATLSNQAGNFATASISSPEHISEHLQRVGSAENALVAELLGKIESGIQVPLPPQPPGQAPPPPQVAQQIAGAIGGVENPPPAPVDAPL